MTRPRHTIRAPQSGREPDPRALAAAEKNAEHHRREAERAAQAAAASTATSSTPIDVGELAPESEEEEA